MNTPKKSFKQFLADLEKAKWDGIVALFEHEVYKLIPGTRNSIREDPPNTSTMTQRHAHVYAKPKGLGGQLYAANFNGSGHDGSSGVEIPASHAEFLRAKGYQIPPSNILESVDLGALDEELYFVYVLREDV